MARFLNRLLAVAVVLAMGRWALGLEPPPASISKLPLLGPIDEPVFALPSDVAAGPAGWTTGAAPANYGYYAGGPPVDDGCQEYSWQLMPQGLIYRPYLAGAKESRFRSVWNHATNDGNIWDITLGGNVGILRYGTLGDARPQGWQLGIEGAGMVRLDIDENRDVDAADYRFGIPLTWGNLDHQVKFAYYHLSSHAGDEFLLKNPGFTRLNYSRDVLVLGQSYYPWEDFRLYGEMGYAVAYDVSQPWEFQFGVDWAPTTRTGGWGAPFAAVNGQLREEVNFGGNVVGQLGWAWRRSPASGLFRVGVEYYNGKDDQFSFFDESVQKTGFGIWYDY